MIYIGALHENSKKLIVPLIQHLHKTNIHVLFFGMRLQEYRLTNPKKLTFLGKVVKVCHHISISQSQSVITYLYLYISLSLYVYIYIYIYICKTSRKIYVKTNYEIFLQWNTKFFLQKVLSLLHFGSCQNCKSSANFVTEIR